MKFNKRIEYAFIKHKIEAEYLIVEISIRTETSSHLNITGYRITSDGTKARVVSTHIYPKRLYELTIYKSLPGLLADKFTEML